MAEEWIEHDGNGRPVPKGTLVEGEFRCGYRQVWSAGTRMLLDLPGEGFGWDWNSDLLGTIGCPPLPYDIIRYRVKRPRGMEVLDSILADLPQPVKEAENV